MQFRKIIVCCLAFVFFISMNAGGGKELAPQGASSIFYSKPDSDEVRRYKNPLKKQTNEIEEEEEKEEEKTRSRKRNNHHALPVPVPEKKKTGEYDHLIAANKYTCYYEWLYLRREFGLPKVKFA